jgi:osmoprotectant transport system ATP-binding protein
MIELKDVSKVYGKQTALAPTTAQFETGRTTVLLGPSGCGKSTLLRIILGLITPTSGIVTVDSEKVDAASVQTIRRKIGYVIQDGGLFPHLTVEQNITLLARHLQRPAIEIAKRVGELSKLAQIDESLLARFPAELSGGQRQRVGLMRALMLDPPTLLLDEPLGALDPITRNELQRQLKEIIGRLKKTVVLVTHDLSEAAYLGDSIALMRGGRIVQFGTAHELRTSPAEPYVTDFLTAQRPLDATGGASA